MIITVTCNPAIDMSIRDDTVTFDVGGKGINVSKVLKNLGLDSLATGLMGRDNSGPFINELERLGIAHDFIMIEGKIRTNTKRIIGSELYEENEKGPDVSEESVKELFELLNRFHGDIVVISGSAPKNVSPDLYEKMVSLLKGNGNTVILDCDRELLRNGIRAVPDMIKPNIREITELLECEYDEDHIIEEVRSTGIPLTVISKGKDGALFVFPDETYECEAVKVNYGSALAAGDAMVAGYVYALVHEMDREATIRMMMAAASASVETAGSKAPDKERIMNYCDRIKIRKNS